MVKTPSPNAVALVVTESLPAKLPARSSKKTRLRFSQPSAIPSCCSPSFSFWSTNLDREVRSKVSSPAPATKIARFPKPSAADRSSTAVAKILLVKVSFPAPRSNKVSLFTSRLRPVIIPTLLLSRASARPLAPLIVVVRETVELTESLPSPKRTSPAFSIPSPITSRSASAPLPF